MEIIGITGYARAGKNTLANIIHEGYGHHPCGFADELKRDALQINPILEIDEDVLSSLTDLVEFYGWEKAKEYPAVREYLQFYGQHMRETKGENYWVNRLEQFIKKNNYKKVVIYDVRYDNEARWVTQNGGHIIKVCRSGVTRVNNHSSEDGIDVKYIDAVLHNEGAPSNLQHSLDLIQWLK